MLSESRTTIGVQWKKEIRRYTTSTVNLLFINHQWTQLDQLSEQWTVRITNRLSTIFLKVEPKIIAVVSVVLHNACAGLYFILIV